jgi:LysR family transcriptional regulator, regulator of abg operon
MKLTQLQDLVAIVEHGGLRAAARSLEMPQPALTRSVRSLERELGVVLFAREAKGMALTPLGRLFHERASSIVAEARRARDELAQHQGDDQGDLVVGLSIMPHLALLPQALPQFRQRYPRVRLRVVEGLFPDIERQVRNGSVDFYIGAAPRIAPAPGLVSELLFENTRAVVARKDHPLARARTLEELAGAQWATTSVDYVAAHDLQQLFKSRRLGEPAVIFQAQTALSLMIGLMHSDLLALLPVQWNDSPLTRDALQPIPLKEVFPAPPIVMIRRPDLPLTPAAEFFGDMMRRHAPVKRAAGRNQVSAKTATDFPARRGLRTR